MRLLKLTALLWMAVSTVCQAASAQSDVCEDKRAKANQEALAFYPAAAMANHLEGSATITCVIAPNGAAKSCTLNAEKPLGHGFGDAALAMAAATANAPIVRSPQEIAAGSKTYVVEFRLSPPQITPNMLSMTAWSGNPHWIRVPDLDDLAFALRKAGVREGLAGHMSMSCSVAADGRVRECSVVSESPENSNLGKAALILAPFFRMSSVTEFGCPVVGAKITMPMHVGTRQ